MGILFGGHLALSNAAREVARYTSTVAAGQSPATIEGQALPILRRSIPGYNGSALVSSAYCYSTNAGTPTTYSQKVTITIRYGHQLFVPLVGAIIDRIDGTPDNRYTTTVREEMKVESQPLKATPGGVSPCTTLNP